LSILCYAGLGEDGTVPDESQQAIDRMKSSLRDFEVK
jgi:hypothetical protein